MIDWNSAKYTSVGHRSEVALETVGLMPLIKKVLETGKGCVSRFYQEGYTDRSFDDVKKNITDLNGKMLYESISAMSEEHIYMWGDAFVEITHSKSNLTTIGCVSSNDKITAMCKEIASTFKGAQKKGYVFAITKGSNGNLQLTRIGFAGSKLERGNYTADICKDYDYIIEDLNAKDPSGRIVILDGPPGNGKSYMIRAILMDATKSMFVIVPPNMVASLGGPELLPLLLRTREDYGKSGPTTFILEDADQCLAPRAGDNMSSISSMLNFGDGLFGSLFDIRIIATTNAKAKDIDPAITRDMRLSKRISIQPHRYEDADRIYKRLFNDEKRELPKPSNVNVDRMKPLNEKKTYSLAEIYKLARDNGWKPEKVEETVKSNIYTADEKPYPEFYEDDPEDYQ